MAGRRSQVDKVERLEERLGIWLERALDLAVLHPHADQLTRIRHLTRMRRAATQVIFLADKALAILRAELRSKGKTKEIR